MVPLAKMDHQEHQVTPDPLDPMDPLAEGGQELWVSLEPMVFQEERDPRVRRVLRVCQDSLVSQAQTDLLDFQELFLKAVEIFCVLPSALRVLLDLQECLDLRVIQAIKEVKESWGKMVRRGIRARRVHQESQELWDYRALGG